MKLTGVSETSNFKNRTRGKYQKEANQNTG